MKNNSEEPLIEYQQLEIKKISIAIAQKYQLYDKNFAYQIAEELYTNGIHFYQFVEEYYQKPFNLDEIIRYLIQKKKREMKIKTIQIPNEKETLLSISPQGFIANPRKKVKHIHFLKY